MKRILVPIDLSAEFDQVVENSRNMATAFQAEIRMIYIIPPLPHEIRNKLEINSVSTIGDMVGKLFSMHSYDDIRKEMAQNIKKIRKKILEIKKHFIQDGIEIEAFILEGKTEESILAEADEYKPDMIIIGSQGYGYRFKSMAGGIYSNLIKSVICPVMVIPPLKAKNAKNTKEK